MNPPSPHPSPWQEYLAGIRTLQAIRDERASGSVAATRAASAARAELALVRERLARQRERLTGAAGSADAPRPGGLRLDLGGPERAHADALVADGADAVPAALRQCRRLIEDGDAVLSGRHRPPDRRWRSWVVVVAAATLLLVMTTAAITLLTRAPL